MRGLLDTSVFIAAESGRPLDEERIPEETALSVVTLAESQAGVLATDDVAVRARRMATLATVGDIEVVGVDEPRR
jgi:predicted nucleic acid-binding protein